MNSTPCFEPTNFNKLKELILKNNTQINLSEKLIADKETLAYELAFENKYLEYVASTPPMIVVIDTTNTIPTYTCTPDADSLSFSPYESRFELDNDMKTRKDDWCSIINTLL